MRALFRPFALHAAYTPIETIVFFCIIGTLAYFHILSAIKNSAFLDPTHSVYALPTLRPAHALYRRGEWVGVREGKWMHAVKAKKETSVEVQQVIFTLDGYKTELSLASPPLSTATANLTHHLSTTFQSPSGRAYPALCYKPSEECFTVQHTGARALTHTFAFKPGGTDDFISGLTGELDVEHPATPISASAVFTDTDTGVRFEVDKSRATEPIPLHQMRNGKWIAYAARALVVRFWDLAKKADSLDILLILAGYILMHTTFYLLLTRSRALGSSFFLPLAILSSAVLALLIALPIAMALRIPIDPVALTEALPFLVCTVGFDKPLRLARAVFLHPHLTVPPALVPGTSADASGYPVPSSTTYQPPSALAPPPPSAASLQQLKPAPRIITESLSHVYAPIIRDYVLEIAVLMVGAYSRVGGLKEVCALAALILAVDCLLLCTYLTAILGVMVEVRRIKTLRHMTRSRSNSLSSASTSVGSSSTATLSRPFVTSHLNPSSTASASGYASPSGVRTPKAPSLRERVKSVLLGGEKGSGLPGLGEVVVKGRKVRVGWRAAGGRVRGVKNRELREGKEGREKENPVARLKLLLIASFLTLHILNFITPLTPSKHIHSSLSYASAGVGPGALSNVRKVDITAPGMRAVLGALVDAEMGGVGAVGSEAREVEDDAEVTVEGGEVPAKSEVERDMYVKVSPPVYVRVVLPFGMGGVGKPASPSWLAKLFSSGSQRQPAAHSSALGHKHSFSSPHHHQQPQPHAHHPAPSRSTSEHLDSFMSAWTSLVGDPILSKWIVAMLALSVALNGYLLKGIAAGFVGSEAGARVLAGVQRSLGQGAGGMVEGGGVRFEGVSDVEDEEDVKEKERKEVVVVRPRMVERERERPLFEVRREVPPPVQIPSPVVNFTLTRPSPPPVAAPVVPIPQSPTAVAGPSVGTFTLEDVDRKLKAEKKKQSPTPPHTEASASTSEDSSSSSDADAEGTHGVEHVRTLEECMDVFENGPRPLSESLRTLNDEEVILLAMHGKIAAYALEKVLGMEELERAVRIRRALISRASKTQTLESSDIPLTNYDYSRVIGACCENVVGYIPLPLGIAGPLNVDGELLPIPMATAEGTLVASTSRGSKALNAGGGVTTVVTQDAMTRGPAIDFPSVAMAAHAKMWIDTEEGYLTIKESFESTSRFAKLKSLKTALAGRTLFVRFATATGDAMGMNMISKGTEKALETIQKFYPEMVVLALSGNYCTDKKSAAINWIEGRGKSVVAEAVIPGKVVKSVLKTTVGALVNLNIKKNLVGSAMAGAVGGFNAHAANILTAVFLATGQDPAQNVESSQCMTLMEAINDGEDLLMTISMPCIEVGTVGGGTVLAPQQAVLEMLGIKGAHPTHPGQNAQRLARLIAAAVMAGELSLLAALAAGHLIRAHMAHNRSQLNTPASSVPPTPGASGGVNVVQGILVAEPEREREGEKKKATVPLAMPPLTPSSSTASLPPYSQ